MSAKMFPWPKDAKALTLQCAACQNLFDAYPGDEELVASRLCPMCWSEQGKKNNLAAFWIGGGLVVAGVGLFVWVMWRAF